MNEPLPLPSRYGRKAVTISAVCFLGGFLALFSGSGFLNWIGLLVIVGPAAVLGEIVAVFYALKALGSEKDEKILALLALLLAVPVLFGTLAIFFLASGGLKSFYH